MVFGYIEKYYEWKATQNIIALEFLWRDFINVSAIILPVNMISIFLCFSFSRNLLIFSILRIRINFTAFRSKFGVIVSSLQPFWGHLNVDGEPF